MANIPDELIYNIRIVKGMTVWSFQSKQFGEKNNLL